MGFVIGTAPDALLAIEYENTRSASRWSNSFMKIARVKHNCKFGSDVSVFRSAYDAKCAIDEIVERESEIGFRDTQTYGFFAIRNKLNIEQLKIYELTLTEVENV